MQNVSVNGITAWIKKEHLLGLTLGRGKSFKKCRGGSLAACVVLTLFHSVCTGNVNSVALVLMENYAISHSIDDIFKAL